ncbi:26S proteasome non-ATPase-like protein regulatory subunit 9 [Geopyxis carbonaria]|nr:26S proteasome non-ATPase-like protein regulatory subunit 9 [Geopyxis carbonaria]
MDIHSATIPRADTSGGANSDEHESKSKNELLQLMVQKDKVEAELKALGTVLDSHKVSMNTSLTTFDGYPRDDIDVPQIRTTRARIIHLRNDYKSLMDQIEIGLHAHHAVIATSLDTNSKTPKESSGISQSFQPPFAKIKTVSPNSPAELSGMQVGDYIKQFGTINALNHQNLSKLAEIVSSNKDKPISVLLSRKQSGIEIEKLISLIPKTGWGGPGLLGCHIIPL